MNHDSFRSAFGPALLGRRCGLLALLAALTACGGGGSDQAAPTTVSIPTVTVPTTPTNTTVAKECVATVAAVDMGTAGSQLDLTTPVVVELKGLAAPSVIQLQNLTAAGSFTVTPYDLDPSNNCKAAAAAHTTPAGLSTSFTLTAFGSAGTRHFVDIQQVTPSIIQLCALSGSTPSNCEPSKQTIFGTVLDASNQAIADAKVTVANDGALVATTTDSQGNFILKTDLSTLPSAFSATVSKAGFVPLALSFTKPTTANLLSASTQKMTPTGTDYAVIEVEPTVHHLGDSNFSGSVNSGFQYPTAEGATFSRTFAVQAAALSKPIAAITFIAKGVECADQVMVNGRLAFAAGNSDASGSYSSYAVNVASSLFVAGSNTFSIVSKTCSGTDLDDFEFQNIVIHFQ